jgi:hypothetical protein
MESKAIILKFGPLLVAVALSTGCATTYTPTSGEQMATVRNVGLGAPHLCISGKVYSPPKSKDASDGFEVPAGSRITIGADWTSMGATMNALCHPSLSFVPTYGRTYVLNSGTVGGRCVVELVRVDTSSETGLAVERSIWRGICGED